jgi:isopentenyl diphosphate isomerase/L-lactate dehydrogenase-like FMN-dependent dehydrogenase
MSLDREKRSRPERRGSTILKAVALGATVVGAAGTGMESGMRNTLEAINRHVLTPAAIHDLKSKTEATDADIAKLEARLRTLLLQELLRQIDQR